MTEYTRENIPDDLRWLANNVKKWLKGYEWACTYRENYKPTMFWSNYVEDHPKINQFNEDQWQAARQALGLGLDQPEVTEAEEEAWREKESKLKETSDGSTASYYQLPKGATELYHLIIHKNMNAQLGEIFRAAYRYGQSSHSDQLRDARKIKAYIEQEIERLENKCIG